jgi:putative transposase
VIDGAMYANKYGKIILACWSQIPAHFQKVTLDAFVVMPNHIHGIVVITDAMHHTTNAEAQHAAPVPALVPARLNVQPASLGALVRSFKSATTQQINMTRKSPGMPVWQRNYYEHIVRHDSSLNRIREYILKNPGRWADDPENPNNLRAQ